jgi:hypothetical protein
MFVREFEMKEEGDEGIMTTMIGDNAEAHPRSSIFIFSPILQGGES